MPAPNRNEKGDFITPVMAMHRLNLCRATTVKLASDAGALFRVGHVQRIDWCKLSGYLKDNCAEKMF